MIWCEAMAYDLALAARPFIVALTKSNVLLTDDDAPRLSSLPDVLDVPLSPPRHRDPWSTLPRLPTAKTSVEELPLTPTDRSVVQAVCALQLVPSCCRIGPASPTAKTSVTELPQTPSRNAVALVGALQRVPPWCRIVPSGPTVRGTERALSSPERRVVGRAPTRQRNPAIPEEIRWPQPCPPPKLQKNRYTPPGAGFDVAEEPSSAPPTLRSRFSPSPSRVPHALSGGHLDLHATLLLCRGRRRRRRRTHRYGSRHQHVRVVGRGSKQNGPPGDIGEG